MDDNILDQEWSAGSLLRFAFPTITMMIFMGLYTIVDTIFVAQFVNTDALSAINIVCPIINSTVGLGTMIATGGNAIISRKMGAGRQREAKEDFTLLVITGAVAGFLILLGGIIWIDKIIYALGASGLLFSYCKGYLMTLLLFIPANVLQTLFSNLFATAGKPGLGFGLSVLAGTANLILDYIFIVPCGLGIRGAAAATGLGYSLTAAAGLLVFRKRDSLLHFQKPVFRGGVLFHASANGLSELATSLVSGITTLLFNLAMLKYIGEDGVAAITIIMYVLMFVSALFIGYSYGAAPMISYYHGEGNHEKLKKLVRFSVRFILGASALCAAVSALATPALVGVFTRPDSPVYALAVTGNRLCSIALLFLGLNVFASSMFTALSNGVVSAVLAFSRSFLFTVACVQLLPLLLGVTGVWLATPAAELLGLLMSAALLARHQKRYGY